MSSSATTGLEVRSGSRPLRDAVELISSMRFAITLLTVICIASVIGTVIRQHEPFVNYVNQFGPFWAEVFGAVGMYSIYSAWWFLLILAFLVISTSLCIARNTPKVLHDLKTYKEHIREQSLQAFHHKTSGELAEGHEAALARVTQLMQRNGWKAKAQVRQDGDAVRGVMVAARKGGANRIGYLAAHAAIVLICLGGLFDGDLVVRAQMWLAGKEPYTGGGFIADVPEKHRLSLANPTFRGNLLVPEGARSNVVLLNQSDGVLLQPLPFDIELKKFIVEYYETGMPKLFASEIVIHDHETGQAVPATVKVNEPAFHRGVAIYQSSFDDGGSKLRLRAYPMNHRGEAFDVSGTVGGATTLSGGDEKYTLELAGLRVINVENLGTPQDATDVRKVNLVDSLQQHLGSGAKAPGERTLRNVGPSVTYRLRDASGQAREFHNYMLPVELDGQRVFLAGVRENLAEPFRYLRIPADDSDSIDTWMRLHAALQDPALRERAITRYVAKAIDGDKPELAQQLTISARRGLNLFAGAEPVEPGGPLTGGLQALADFMQANVPEADRARTSDVLIRILNGVLYELTQMTREAAGLPPLPGDEKTQAFMTQAVLSLSDAGLYPAPLLLQLQDFEHVQASVFQVARAPGKYLVYLGCLLLVIGVFAMLYVRERRLWIWLQPAGAGRTRLTAALSSTRKTLDTDREFESLKAALLPAVPAEEAAR
ncbi:cytochrome c biogenesis protein ResB [Caldimonas thermodepolymerans]|uniref:Cytochrome c biogenesis protein n=2 Tax=Caldimonas thermodepolymerans TaxID=215580 RepID=A0AA46HV60_9BURK|nr:cytochrome c biogenesis protein ResB [Caldimonas thermodepolymerans]RDH98792.1 cytochrome c biogenesis protein [Caldimonas thermodepolymerans]TCP06190.1 cytochrome c biogenesis protein [Caldimonas thermodepolymerans]UZG45201.1 cytochrome c biogenesis protein ResB [Caldimonas thermodepolymerans]UZG48956.1 cytochrome c biogenesis protein ResB [Caldimonas thermodepolymerans]